MTATQLIRQAALATGSIEVKEGKVLTYVDSPLVPVPDAICWLCGGETGGLGQPASKAIKDTFTDHPWARGQCSKSLCPGCVFSLGARPLRNYSVLATAKQLRHPSRAAWRDILLHPLEPPFVACLAVSGQKHLTFKAPVNYSRNVFVVALEEQQVEVDPVHLADVLGIVEALYAYFTKDEICAGHYSQYRIQQCGLDRWAELDAQLQPWHGSRLLDLSLFVAQKREQEVTAHEPSPAAITGGKSADSGSAQLGFNWL